MDKTFYVAQTDFKQLYVIQSNVLTINAGS